LTKLTTLELEQGCGISDVSALFGATGMLQLNFEGNHVSDLSQFLQFPQLTRLFLHRNPIDCVAQRDSLTALRMRKVTVFLDCTN